MNSDSLPTYLALDVGEKRIGLAIGSFMAFGRGAIDNDSSAIEVIKSLVNQENINQIIVGIPERKPNIPNLMAEQIESFIEQVKLATKLPIVRVNEAYSSRQAESELRRDGVDTQAEKWRVDERAAELILNQYLLEQGGE